MLNNKNIGTRLLNFSEENFKEESFTIVVSGLGRSGTTMAARMLTAGNVPMGVRKEDVLHEDVGLSSLIEGNEITRALEILRIRNSKYKIWGFKRPLIVKHRLFIENHFRNPRYIILFRDPLAVANRNSLSIGFNLQQSLEIYFDQMKEVMEFVRNSSRPKLLVSYEKALQDPHQLGNELCKFCRINTNLLENMMQTVKANDPAYLEKTRR